MKKRVMRASEKRSKTGSIFSRVRQITMREENTSREIITKTATTTASFGFSDLLNESKVEPF
jgi:hypothetical protein